MARQSGGIEFASLPSSIVTSACDVSNYSRHRGLTLFELLPNKKTRWYKARKYLAAGPSRVGAYGGFGEIAGFGAV